MSLPYLVRFYFWNRLPGLRRVAPTFYKVVPDGDDIAIRQFLASAGNKIAIAQFTGDGVTVCFVYVLADSELKQLLERKSFLLPATGAPEGTVCFAAHKKNLREVVRTLKSLVPNLQLAE